MKPLFDYLDDFKAEVNQRFDILEKKVDVLQATADALAKEVKDMRDEHIILYRRLELLESWAKKVSQKLDIPLPN